MLLDGEAIGINLPTPEVLWRFWSRSLVPGEVPELTVQVLRCEHDSLVPDLDSQVVPLDMLGSCPKF